ncbi:MAG: serine protease [Lachnospiraceae bacterium]|jgi:serine protease Do|nr:serine protease [Lachnospiraceae bacterium]
MSEKDQNNQSDFLIEKIKQRPINRRKLIRRTIITAAMAVIFGLIACFTFLVLEPIFSKWLNPEEEPQVIVLPEDQEEMLPEEMLAENQPTESPSPEPSEEGVVLEPEQIEEILSGVVLTKQNYKELYAALSEYTEELNRYMVMVTAVTSNIDWFSTVQESSNQTSGVIVDNNGKELLVLTNASPLRSAESLSLTFYNGQQANAQIKQQDSYTNLAVLSVALTDLPEELREKEEIYPEIDFTVSEKQPGTPVIALGSPMGTGNSIGYGMITSTSIPYSVPDRNYRILQTDILGSQNGSGVLFNLDGQVVGIITGNKSVSDMKNVIYAYKTGDLKRILENLLNGKELAYLGISGVNVTPEASGDLGVPLGGFVTKVDMDSPAMLAGIQQGDVITNIDGRGISTFNEYTGIIMQLEPGTTVEMTVKRKSQEEYKEMNFTMEVQKAK